MLKRHTFWLRTSVVILMITAIVHSISLFVDPVAQNETERQLIELMTTYRNDLGGFHPTMADLMTALSSCFSLLCLLGGLTLWYVARQNVGHGILKGIVAIHIVVFGICFAMMSLFTFLPPIVLTGLAFLSLVITSFTIPREFAGTHPA